MLKGKLFYRGAAMRPGFNYAAAMMGAMAWSEANLRALITHPQAFVPATLLASPGHSMPADVDDVIAYLKTLK